MAEFAELPNGRKINTLYIVDIFPNGSEFFTVVFDGGRQETFGKDYGQIVYDACKTASKPRSRNSKKTN